MSNIKKQTVKVEKERWEKALNNALDKALKKVQIDGFRKGHVPKNVFLKKYGKESLYDDAINECLQEKYPEVVGNERIIDQPMVNILSCDDNGFEAEITLQLYPTVTLGQYKDLKVKKEEVKVTKKEIEDTIEGMRKRYSESVIKDGKVEKGDIAIIDYEGFKDNVAFEGGKGTNYSLEIGSNTFIPGFEEQIIGMKKGEEKDLNLTFPEDYHEESLKGKEVVFKVKVNEIKEVKLPEFDKEFFEDLALEGIDSKEALEKMVKENIEAKKQANVDNKYIEDLLEKVSENATVEVPSVMAHEEAHYMVHQFEDRLRMQGMDLNTFLKYTGSKEEDLIKEMMPEATKKVKYRLVLEEIVKQEKIIVSDEEVQKEIKKACEDYQMSEEEFVNKVASKDIIKAEIELNKALDIIKL